MAKCNFNKIPLQLTKIILRHWYSPFPKKTSGGMLLNSVCARSDCSLLKETNTSIY